MDLTDSSDTDVSDNETQDRFDVEQAKPKISGHLEQMKKDLGLDKYSAKREKKRLKRLARKEKKRALTKSAGGVVTLASKVKPSVVPSVVVYKDPRNRKKARVQTDVKEKQQPVIPEREEISMKQARFEVYKLGVSAMNKEEQYDANVSLAVKLGAKPPKNKCLEYNVFKENRQKEKELEEKEEEEFTMKKSMTKKGGKKFNETAKQKKVKKRDKVRQKNNFQLKIGKFDGGMLKLSARDLAK